MIDKDKFVDEILVFYKYLIWVCFIGDFILMNIKWILFIVSGGGWVVMYVGNFGYSWNGKIENVDEI